MDNSKLSALLLQANPWCGHDNPIWLCSSVTFLRNLRDFHFPNRLDLEKRKQIVGLIGQRLTADSHLTEPLILKGEECTARDRELLFEHFLSAHPFVHAQGGEAFAIDKSGRFLAVINMEDHLELTRCGCKDELEKNFQDLVHIEIALGQALNYAFSPTFGYLTSNPYHCGTALRLRVFLQIPAIIHLGHLDQVLEQHKNDYVNTSGLTGNAAELVGDVLVASNAYSLGVAEEKILSELHTFTTHILVEEKGLRSRLQSENRPELKDKISRAYGLIKNGYQLETFESLNALSLLKLALDLNWVTGANRAKLNELFFTCRRAHLLAQVGADIPQEELAHRRALYLRQGIDNMQLKL